MSSVEDLELELSAGFAQCFGGGALPPADAVQAMCRVEEARDLLHWLARVMQTEELMLTPENGSDPGKAGLESVLKTLSSDPLRMPIEALQVEVNELEAQIDALSGPSGRLAQLVFRRDRLSALGPAMTCDGVSVKSCERATHQLSATVSEEVGGLLTDLGYLLMEIDAHASALTSLHDEEGGASTAPLLTQISLENLIALGDKHGEHVRKYLVLEQVDRNLEDMLWDGRQPLDVADQFAVYSQELERLKRVGAWGEEENLDAEVTLAQAKAELAAVRRQATVAREGRWDGGIESVGLEEELMRAQQETIAAEREWEDLRAAGALPLVSELAAMQGADVLEADTAVNLARQEWRLACQKKAIHLLHLHAARLDMLEIAMCAELESHREVAEVISAATMELSALADARRAVRQRAAAKLGCLLEEGAEKPTDLPSAHVLLPLHVALGGVEDGHLCAFLSLDVLASEARGLRERRARAERGCSQMMSLHEGETRALERQVGALQRVLWAHTAGSEPVCMPGELQRALERLESVKGRLDTTLDSVLRTREEVQSRESRDRTLFTDFFLRPQNVTANAWHLRREAGGTLASPTKISTSATSS